MKKNLKVALLSALAVAGVATVASCTTDAETTTSTTTSSSTVTDNGTLNISVNYQSGSKVSGVSYQMADTVTLTYGDNITLTKNTILPTWSTFASKNNMTIKEGNDYSRTQKEDWNSYASDGFVDADGNYLDLVMGSQSLYATSITNNKLVAISDYLDSMPNFKAWTQENSAIWASMASSDGKVYYTPYFDGLDDIEKMNLMNTDYVEKLLDVADASLSTDRTITSVYTATVSGSSSESIKVSVDGAVKTITADLSATNNAVTKQNALSTKDGANLVAALKEALIAEYGSAISTSAGGSAASGSAVYNNLSEIFVGENACYNVDDLVALLRCVKANSTYLTGDATTAINPLVPRTAQNNRTYQLAEMASWWGVRGLSGENSNLYFDTEGELQSAETKEETYTALGYLHNLYEEGLIVETFSTDSSNKELGSTEFRKAGIVNGTAFMVYDYNATTTQYNADTYTGSKTNFEAVLPPVAKWAGDDTVTFEGTDYSGFFHFTEDNRALKTGGWAIPTTTDNLAGALVLMDYMFSEEGAHIQDYGPDSTKDGSRVYWNDPDGSVVLNGDDCPVITDTLKEAVKDSGYTWNDYYRLFVGSTQGIGHVRSAGLDYQCTFSDTGRAGLEKLETAISDGAFVLAKTTFESNTDKFFNSVPTQITIASSAQTTIDNSAECTTMSNFWNNSQSKVVWTGASVIMGGYDSTSVTAVITSYSTFKSIWSTYDSVFVAAYRDGITEMGI